MDDVSKSTPLVIGIAGGTGSGKTTIVNAIQARLGTFNIAYIPQDAFYKDQSHLSLSDRSYVNYDHPDTIDTRLLIDLIKELKSFRVGSRPIYDFKTHSRLAETIIVQPKPIVIVEGILIFCDSDLRSLFDLKIFVDTDSDVRFIRRLTRNIAERGHTMEYAIQQYLSTVRPMHRQFVEPTRDYADVIIPGGGENKKALEMIVSSIRSQLRGELEVK